MTKLKRSLRKFRQRQELTIFVKKIGWIATTAFLLYILPCLPPTNAFFTSQAETGLVTFKATYFADLADNLTLSPGNAMTNNSPGEPGPAFHVAQVVNGQIELDFGTYPVGNKRNFSYVLGIKNLSADILDLNWHFSESLEQFFETQAATITLNPEQQVKLDFKLDTFHDDQAGEYSGTLHISAQNGLISWDLPTRLHLVDNGKDYNRQNSSSPDGEGASENVNQEDAPDAPTDGEGASENVNQEDAPDAPADGEGASEKEGEVTDGDDSQ